MSISKNSKRNVVLAGACLAGGLALAFPAASQASLLSNVVFNDTLATNGSTLGSSGAPTATSTNYDVASSKAATSSSLTSGSPLKLIGPSTSGGVTEVQALFTSTPVQLTTIGQSVELTVTFTNAAGLNQNSSSSVDIGLYNSGGSAPYNTLENGSAASGTQTGIDNTNAGMAFDNTGGVQGWLGYEGDYFGGSSTKIYTRPAQLVSAGDNKDQALVADGQTGGVEEPDGTTASFTSQNSSETALSTTTGSNTYTAELLITLSAASTYTLSYDLYEGSSDTGTQVGTNTIGTLSGANFLTSGFDGLAIGYRESDSEASEMDISQVQVTVPEPATLGILSLAGLGLMRRRRRP